jgi:hypothetical protein
LKAPGQLEGRCWRGNAASRQIALWRRSSAASISTPLASIASSTSTSGISISRYTASSAGSAASFGQQRAMQAQGDVGVLGGVRPWPAPEPPARTDLLRALAGDVLVPDRVVAEVTLRQRIHVVAAGGGVQTKLSSIVSSA